MGFSKSKATILAISSGGGHWVQLLRLRPAFEGQQVVFASVRQSYAEDVRGDSFVLITDATRWDRLRLIYMVLQVTYLVLVNRPTVIISTGAAPGYIAIRLGKFIGARTIWLDSIANAETISLSGQKISKYADLWLTQWEHLATDDGPFYSGSVI